MIYLVEWEKQCDNIRNNSGNGSCSVEPVAHYAFTRNEKVPVSCNRGAGEDGEKDHAEKPNR